MNKKLTITINEEVIENANFFAKKNKTNLSKLVEDYLQSIVENKTKELEITPLVKSLSGVIEVPNDFDIRRKF